MVSSFLVSSPCGYNGGVGSLLGHSSSVIIVAMVLGCLSGVCGLCTSTQNYVRPVSFIMSARKISLRGKNRCIVRL